jgi:polo-like kinase 1
MEYMHKMRVIHRDLKLANLLLDDQFNLKIADLGLAAKLEFSDEKRRTMCGTPNYIAPEIISGETGHSYEVDIWSAGIICYVMFYGNPPF